MKRIRLLAHNIRSLWNIGSLFRSSDCFSVEHIILSGYSASPPRKEISKTAIGAEEWIEWSYEKDPMSVIENHKKDGWSICSLECCEGSINISTFDPPDKILLVLGNEILGVSKEMLEASDTILSIPMYGKKESLNVTVAAGIALNALRNS